MCDKYKFYSLVLRMLLWLMRRHPAFCDGRDAERAYDELREEAKYFTGGN